MKKSFWGFWIAVSAFLSGCSFHDAAVSAAQERVRRNEASCVLLKDGRIAAQEKGRGLAPLFTVLDKYGSEMEGGVIVDKVIGKAAASIIVVGKAAAVYTELISEPGLALLQKHNIRVEYQQCVPQILNRRKDGLCPMEKRVAEIDDPRKAVEALRQD